MSRREKEDLKRCQSWLRDLARSHGLCVHEDIREALEDTVALLQRKKAHHLQQPVQQQARTMTNHVNSGVQPCITQYGLQLQEDGKRIGRLFTISCQQPSLFEMLRVSAPLVLSLCCFCHSSSLLCPSITRALLLLSCSTH